MGLQFGISTPMLIYKRCKESVLKDKCSMSTNIINLIRMVMFKKKQ